MYGNVINNYILIYIGIFDYIIMRLLERFFYKKEINFFNIM